MVCILLCVSYDYSSRLSFLYHFTQRRKGGKKMAPNILLTRIDNRLVHGQVGVVWCNALGANLIVVANDDVAEDPVQQNLMDMVLPEAVGIRFFSIQKTCDVIHKASDSQKIFLVTKTPQDVLRLLKGGVPLKKVNVGNMHYAEGKKQVSSRVSVDDDDIATFKEIVGMGVEVEERVMPDSPGKDIMSVLQ